MTIHTSSSGSSRRHRFDPCRPGPAPESAFVRARSRAHPSPWAVAASELAAPRSTRPSVVQPLPSIPGSAHIPTAARRLGSPSSTPSTGAAIWGRHPRVPNPPAARSQGTPRAPADRVLDHRTAHGHRGTTIFPDFSGTEPPSSIPPTPLPGQSAPVRRRQHQHHVTASGRQPIRNGEWHGRRRRRWSCAAVRSTWCWCSPAAPPRRWR